MKRALAAALLTAAALALLAPAASAASGPPTDPSPIGGVGSGPYIGDVPKPGPGGQ
jgi:ABC-type sugar transport system substrate-binding protein